MTVDCSECHDLDLVDQQHAVGDQKCAGEFVHNHDDDHEGPSPEVLPIRPVFNRKEAFCRRDVKAKFTLCTGHGEGLT